MSFWVLLMIAAMMALIVVGMVRAPRSPGRLSMTLSVLCGLWWTLCVIVRHATPNLMLIDLFAKLAWIGIMGVPLFWALSFLTYVRGEQKEKTWQIASIALVVVATLAVALSNDWHHLMYSSVIDAAKARYSHGPIFYAAMLVVYVSLAAGFVFGLSRLRRAHGLHRWQLASLLLAAALPWLANYAYNFHGLRVFNDDPTPFVFAATGLTILYAQRFARLFVLPPVGRDAIFTVLPDPVIVFDTECRILELNTAAATLPGMPKNPIGAVLSQPQELAAVVAEGAFCEDMRREISFASTGRAYEISFHSLSPWGRDEGWMLLLRDITMRKADEAKLAKLSRSLQARLKDNVVLQNQLMEKVSRDHLTGLFNRRHAAETLPQLVGTGKRGRSNALFIIDIDHFKSVNDRFGHDVGDRVIVAFAHILKSDAKSADLSFRWGGEEFLVLLPDADQEEALALCAVWRAMFAAVDVGVRLDAPLTFSAGVYLIPDGSGIEFEQAVKEADTLLYEAKAAGRNAARFSTPTTPLLMSA